MNKKIRSFTFVVSLIILIGLLVPSYSLASEEISFSIEYADGKTCQEIGMIPNDESQAKLNYSLLCDELNTGTTILVDDKYYIYGAKIPTPITSNIN
ncbi:hypothetical protein, partial [Dehalobacter sp. UNSWDHB]|uniref:hypothetical protein n=1 Tax=Dehalobacter sp. UNSWDHB TaxID=1339256 RepID=UPI0012697F34